MRNRSVGLFLVLLGIAAMVGEAIASDAQYAATGSAIDTRTVVTILCGMLTATIGLYMRNLDAKVEKMASSEMVTLLFAQMTKTQDAFAENLSNLNYRMNSHSSKLSEVQLGLATHHPTKRDVQDAVVAALAPVVVRLSSLENKIDHLSNQGA